MFEIKIYRGKIEDLDFDFNCIMVDTLTREERYTALEAIIEEVEEVRSEVKNLISEIIFEVRDYCEQADSLKEANRLLLEVNEVYNLINDTYEDMLEEA